MTTDRTGAIGHVFEAWDEALGAKDLDASMALYHDDCTLESPLVCYLLGNQDGVVRGKAALRRVFAHQPPQRQRQRFRTGFLSDGTRLTWEYPRQAGDREQMDLAEVMGIEDGLIRHHRVYWGWFAVNMLFSGEHPR